MNANFFKKNKFTFFIIIFFLIAFVLLLQVKGIFLPDGKGANYGDRLDGIVTIEKDDLAKMRDELMEDESIKKVTYEISGRILNVTMTLEKDTSLKKAKDLGTKTKDYLKEDVLNDYDIQVFIKKDDTSENNFPIIGYKSKTDEKFSWTKDREKKEVKEVEE